MSIAEKAEVLKSDYQSQLDKLEEVKQSVSEKIVLLEEMVSEHEQAVLEAKAQGYEEGKASVVLPTEGTGEKLFTQEDMNKLAETAKLEKAQELQPQIDSALQAQAEAQSQLEQLKIDLEASQQAEQEAKAQLEADAQKDAEISAQISELAQQIK